MDDLLLFDLRYTLESSLNCLFIRAATFKEYLRRCLSKNLVGVKNRYIRLVAMKLSCCCRQFGGGVGGPLGRY